MNGWLENIKKLFQVLAREKAMAVAGFSYCLCAFVMYAAIKFVRAEPAVFALFVALAITTVLVAVWLLKVVLQHWERK